MKLPKNDFDGAWKEALEQFFRPLLEICFPRVACAVDWSVPFVWMDKELQEIFRGDDLGPQRADKLTKVRLLDGTDEWILIHVEAQSQDDRRLPLRMYRYHHRLVDRYGARVVSLAILADDNPRWKPAVHTEELLGCRVRFEYPVCKLLELDEAALGKSSLAPTPNPAAIVLLACLRAVHAGRDVESRQHWKWELTRRLYEGGLGKKEILELYRLIGWFITLPEEMELQFHRRIVALEEEKKMPYVTFAEQYGRKEGRKEGQVAILQRQLVRRFGTLPESAIERLKEASIEDLERWSERVLDAPVLEAVFE